MKIAPLQGATAAGAAYGGSSGSMYDSGTLVCMGVIMVPSEDIDEVSIFSMIWIVLGEVEMQIFRRLAMSKDNSVPNREIEPELVVRGSSQNRIGQKRSGHASHVTRAGHLAEGPLIT